MSRKQGRGRTGRKADTEPPPPLEFRVNPYLSLRLEDGITYTYVDGKRFLHCKRLILNIPLDDVEGQQEINSIDDAAWKYSAWMDGGPYYDKHEGAPWQIDPETEFWAHCSNLQAWYEHGYDTRLLESTLAFQLLRKMADAGDRTAARVYDAEVLERLHIANYNTLRSMYLLGIFKEYEFRNPGALREELISMMREGDAETWHKLTALTMFFMRLNKETIYSFKEKTLELLGSGNINVIRRLLGYGFAEPLTREDLVTRGLLESEHVAECLRSYRCYPLLFDDAELEAFLDGRLPHVIAGNKVYFISDNRLGKELDGKPVNPVDDARLKRAGAHVTKKNGVYDFQKDYTVKLKISSSNLYKFPLAACNLTYLTGLSISIGGISSLPAEIKNLVELEWLSIEATPIDKLPSTLGELTRLTLLAICYTNLTELPASFGNLVLLGKISLENNHLRTLPESFGNLSRLKYLSLSNNHLSSLPESMGGLHDLEYLNLDSNKLTNLPDSFGELRNLGKLYLNGNQLTELPDSLTQLEKLNVVGLVSNQLRVFPKGLRGLLNIENLSVKNNKIEKIPNWIDELPGLIELSFANNQITTLPDELCNLPRIFSLSIYGNPIRDDSHNQRILERLREQGCRIYDEAPAYDEEKK